MKGSGTLNAILQPYESQELKQRLLLEGAWIVLTLLVIVVLLYPFMPELRSNDFFAALVVGLFVCFTWGRYVVNFKVTPFARRFWVIVFMTLLCIPVWIYLFTSLTEFQVYYDDNGFENLFDNRSFQMSVDLKLRLKNIMIFGLVSGLVSLVLFPLSVARYLWKSFKKSKKSTGL